MKFGIGKVSIIIKMLKLVNSIKNVYLIYPEYIYVGKSV